MSWTDLGSSFQPITAVQKLSGSSWGAFTLSGPTPGIGSVVVLVLATDNVDTIDGNTTLHSTITDDSGNTYTKAREFTNGQGSAAAGATVSIWYCVLTAALNGSNTWTITLSSAVTAKALTSWTFSKTADTSVSVNATATDLADDAVDAGSMTISGLANAEHLFLRAVAKETATVGMTATSTWTSVLGAATAGGLDDTNMAAQLEFLIATATTATSDPTTSAVDQASVLIALDESVPAAPVAARPSHAFM